MGVKIPMIAHPNWREPQKPTGRSLEDVVAFTLEYAAGLVSPPQVDGEDEELDCKDVAAELRGSVDAVVAALRA